MEERITSENPDYEKVISDPDWLVEDHSKYNFGIPENSIGVDDSGEEYDYGFRTEVGKVQYEKLSDLNYLVSLHMNKNGTEVVEKRKMNLDQLSAWFYSPTSSHYEEVISKIELEA